MGEVDRRYGLVRDALTEHGLDALVVAGSEYTGFEGAVRYLSGFQIVHRYAYVLVPLEGDPSIVFPAEARYVGEHGDSWIEDQVFIDHPGSWLAGKLAGKRVGLYGGDYVMQARDFAALQGEVDLVPFDEQFDLARAVKSDAELESVRDSVRINTEGFHAFHEAYAPGRTAAEVLAPAEKLFVEEGCGRLTMNMVLTGPEFAIARDDFCGFNEARLAVYGDHERQRAGLVLLLVVFGTIPVGAAITAFGGVDQRSHRGAGYAL